MPRRARKVAAELSPARGCECGRRARELHRAFVGTAEEKVHARNGARTSARQRTLRRWRAVARQSYPAYFFSRTSRAFAQRGAGCCFPPDVEPCNEEVIHCLVTSRRRGSLEAVKANEVA